MKVQLFLPLTLAVSVALLGLTKLRKKEHDKEDRRNRFQAIKLRVTYDVLSEYQTEKREAQERLDKSQSAHKTLEEEASMVKTKESKAKGEVDICQGDQVGRK